MTNLEVRLLHQVFCISMGNEYMRMKAIDELRGVYGMDFPCTAGDMDKLTAKVMEKAFVELAEVYPEVRECTAEEREIITDISISGGTYDRTGNSTK